jgi:hypothetical protein
VRVNANAEVEGYNTVQYGETAQSRSTPKFHKARVSIAKLLWNPHSQKHACKVSGMNISKTLDLKPFGMNICKKTGEGEPGQVLANWP